MRRARDVLGHRGDAVRCPVCGSRFSEFAPAWNRDGAICWRCGAHERHRALWLFLHEVRPELLGAARSLLHFAPEDCLERRLGDRVERYDTTDLDPQKGRLQLDLLDLDLPDGAYDVILCSHVLEHIPDDRRAMRELRRVLAPGGWCLVMVPVDFARTETYEDPSITDPAERAAHFWQEDHVRVYGPDVEDRLREAGFAVEAWAPPGEWLEPYGLLDTDRVYCCR